MIEKLQITLFIIFLASCFAHKVLKDAIENRRLMLFILVMYFGGFTGGVILTIVRVWVG